MIQILKYYDIEGGSYSSSGGSQLEPLTEKLLKEKKDELLNAYAIPDLSDSLFEYKLDFYTDMYHSTHSQKQHERIKELEEALRKAIKLLEYFVDKENMR